MVRAVNVELKDDEDHLAKPDRTESVRRGHGATLESGARLARRARWGREERLEFMAWRAHSLAPNTKKSSSCRDESETSMKR